MLTKRNLKRQQYRNKTAVMKILPKAGLNSPTAIDSASITLMLGKV